MYVYVSKHRLVMNSLLAVLVVISRSIPTNAFDVTYTGNVVPTQDSFKRTAKTSFKLSGGSYRYQKGILDNISNTLLDNHRRTTYIRNSFEKRNSTKQQRQCPFIALDKSKTITYWIDHRSGLQQTELDIRFVEGGTVKSNMGSMGRLKPTELQEDDITRIQNIYGQCETIFDAIEVWQGNGKTYFFKGNSYWRFDDAKRRTIPKTSATGKECQVISTRCCWETYFFKRNPYFSYDDINDRSCWYVPAYLPGMDGQVCQLTLTLS